MFNTPMHEREAERLSFGGACMPRNRLEVWKDFAGRTRRNKVVENLWMKYVSSGPVRHCRTQVTLFMTQAAYSSRIPLKSLPVRWQKWTLKGLIVSCQNVIHGAM